MSCVFDGEELVGLIFGFCACGVWRAYGVCRGLCVFGNGLREFIIVF